MPFRQKVMRIETPFGAALPVVVEKAVLAARGLHRGLIEMTVGRSEAVPQSLRMSPRLLQFWTFPERADSLPTDEC
jgi:hypothetical protein